MGLHQHGKLDASFLCSFSLSQLRRHHIRSKSYPLRFRLWNPRLHLSVLLPASQVMALGPRHLFSSQTCYMHCLRRGSLPSFYEVGMSVGLAEISASEMAASSDKIHGSQKKPRAFRPTSRKDEVLAETVSACLQSEAISLARSNRHFSRSYRSITNTSSLQTSQEKSCIAT